MQEEGCGGQPRQGAPDQLVQVHDGDGDGALNGDNTTLAGDDTHTHLIIQVKHLLL